MKKTAMQTTNKKLLFIKYLRFLHIDKKKMQLIKKKIGKWQNKINCHRRDDRPHS